VPVWGRGRSDALIDEPREEAGIDDEGAELRVIWRCRLGSDDFVSGSPLPLKRRDILAHPDQPVAKLFKLGLVADRLTVSGDDDRVCRRRREIDVAGGDRSVDAAAGRIVDNG